MLPTRWLLRPRVTPSFPPWLVASRCAQGLASGKTRRSLYKKSHVRSQPLFVSQPHFAAACSQSPSRLQPSHPTSPLATSCQIRTRAKSQLSVMRKLVGLGSLASDKGSSDVGSGARASPDGRRTRSTPKWHAARPAHASGSGRQGIPPRLDPALPAASRPGPDAAEEPGLPLAQRPRLRRRLLGLPLAALAPAAAAGGP